MWKVCEMTGESLDWLQLLIRNGWSGN